LTAEERRDFVLSGKKCVDLDEQHILAVLEMPTPIHGNGPAVNGDVIVVFVKMLD